MPFEQTLASVPLLTASADDVRSYVNANFLRLRMFVEREIAFREASGQLEADALNWDDVVDEVVARALDDSIEKPDRMRLEPWLYRLAIRYMDQLELALSEDSADLHLESTRRARNERASDEPRLQFHQPDDSMTAESSIADNRISTPEEIAYLDEMITLVQYALRGAAMALTRASLLAGDEGDEDEADDDDDEE